MTLLKDELMKASGLSEDKLRARLLKNAPERGLSKAQQWVGMNAIKENSWAFLTICYEPSDNTLLDRMAKAVGR